MPLDFSNEDDQREFVSGPVPGGSIVIIQLTVLEPQVDNQARDNRFIFQSQKGLRQLYCQFVVVKGTYQGVQFRQNITLPVNQQTERLSDNQIKACNIGGAQLKAICLAAKKSLKMQDVTDLSGMIFPARVKINPRPTQKNDGRVFWNNELALIITPDKEAYTQVMREGEIIMKNGPVTGSTAGTNTAGSNDNWAPASPRDDFFADGSQYENPPVNSYDDIPF